MRALRVALLAVAAALLAPAAAQATLAYVKWDSGYGNRGSYVAANDGTARRLITADGWDPSVSPDGSKVLFARNVFGRTFNYGSCLFIASAQGGKARRLAKYVTDYDEMTRWSPDGKRVLAVVGSEVGRQTLEEITVANSHVRVIATGYFSGQSYSPDGNRVVYSREGRRLDPRLYVADLSGATIKSSPIVTDGVASAPLWGPTGIAFSDAEARVGDPVQANVFLVQPDGSGRRQLTTAVKASRAGGLFASQWSADGTRLLLGRGDLIGWEAYTVEPATGATRDLTGRTDSIKGFGLSHDGTTVLATTGDHPGPSRNVVAVPFGGGKPTILVRNAGSPSWNR